jgi:hypothetical protein
MIVVLPRIEKFEVAARPVQMDFLRNPQALEKGHHAKHSSEIRGSPLPSRSGLNFIKGERLFGVKQSVKNPGPIFRDSHPVLPQEIDNRVARKFLQR